MSLKCFDVSYPVCFSPSNFPSFCPTSFLVKQGRHMASDQAMKTYEFTVNSLGVHPINGEELPCYFKFGFKTLHQSM